MFKSNWIWKGCLFVLLCVTGWGVTVHEMFHVLTILSWGGTISGVYISPLHGYVQIGNLAVYDFLVQTAVTTIMLSGFVGSILITALLFRVIKHRTDIFIQVVKVMLVQAGSFNLLVLCYYLIRIMASGGTRTVAGDWVLFQPWFRVYAILILVIVGCITWTWVLKTKAS